MRGAPGRERRHRLEQLAQPVDAEHAGAAEGRVVDRSEPASAPVWESGRLGARRAARPALMTITGLARGAMRAADMNLRAW